MPASLLFLSIVICIYLLIGSSFAIGNLKRHSIDAKRIVESLVILLFWPVIFFLVWRTRSDDGRD